MASPGGPSGEGRGGGGGRPVSQPRRLVIPLPLRSATVYDRCRSGDFHLILPCMRYEWQRRGGVEAQGVRSGKESKNLLNVRTLRHCQAACGVPDPGRRPVYSLIGSSDWCILRGKVALPARNRRGNYFLVIGSALYLFFLSFFLVPFEKCVAWGGTLSISKCAPGFIVRSVLPLFCLTDVHADEYVSWYLHTVIVNLRATDSSEMDSEQGSWQMAPLRVDRP